MSACKIVMIKLFLHGMQPHELFQMMYHILCCTCSLTTTATIFLCVRVLIFHVFKQIYQQSITIVVVVVVVKGILLLALNIIWTSPVEIV